MIRVLHYLYSCIAALVFSVLLLGSSLTLSATDYSKVVDPLIGTGGIGHTFPGATTPFGMIQLSPSNDFKNWNWCSGYHFSDVVFKGFAHNHISGPGLAGLGDVLLMPTAGKLKLRPGTEENPDSGYRSRISHSTEYASAGYYRIKLDDYDIKVELTASQRVGFHKYTFLSGGIGNIVIDPTHNIMESVSETEVTVLSATRIRGKKTCNGEAGNRSVYFIAEFSKPFDRAVVADGGAFTDKTSLLGDDVNGGVTFKDLEKGESVEVKVALSYVSYEGAERNLAAQSVPTDFDSAKVNAEAIWNNALSSIEIDVESESINRTFYTAMYHSMISPNLISDVDGSYVVEGNVLSSDIPQYSNYSTWDTFRALHPLLTLIDGQHTAEFVNSLASRYGDAGVGLPVWEALGHDNVCMIGYSTVPVMADAIIKDIPGINKEKAYEAMRAAAMSLEKHSPNYDVNGMDDYIQNSFVFGETGTSVSKTVEYNYYDHCLSLLARSLGKEDDADLFEKRSLGYRNLYNDENRYLWPLLSSGQFAEIDTTEWAGLIRHYVSGNVWAYSTYVPHDMGYLIGMHGGKVSFNKWLDDLFENEVKMEGEQHVDISGFIGKYGHGDEPGHQMPYLYSYSGQPWKTQKYVHEVMQTMYNDTREGLVNNEDLGQMSAWYIFSSMGFYPVSPVDKQYIIGSPLVKSASMKLANDKVFSMHCENYDPTKNIYVEKVLLNGKTYKKNYISHADVVKGGVVTFVMTDKPNKKRGVKSSAWPSKVIESNGFTSELSVAFTPFSSDTTHFFAETTTFELSTKSSDGTIYYTLDGTEPSCESFLYSSPVVVDKSCVLTARTLVEGKLPSRLFTHEFTKTMMASLNPTYVLKDAPQRYGKESGASLFDFHYGKVFNDGEWSGFAGKTRDLDVTIDLHTIADVRAIQIGWLMNTGVWIFPPNSITVYVGDTANSLQQVAFLSDITNLTDNVIEVKRNLLEINQSNVRFVRVVVENYGAMPSWHGGEGQIPFLFVDEIVLY